MFVVLIILCYSSPHTRPAVAGANAFRLYNEGYLEEGCADAPERVHMSRSNLIQSSISVTTSSAFRAPDHVRVCELSGEAVLLDLATETYFGLNTTGARMWARLVETSTLEDACQALQEELEVDPKTLRRDLEGLVVELMEQGLLEVR